MKRKIGIILCIILAASFFGIPITSSSALAAEKNDNKVYFDLEFYGKHINFDSHSICDNKEKLELWGRNAGNKKLLETAKKVQNMGFSPYTSLQFIFPGMEDIFCALEKKINIESKDAEINLNKSGKFSISKEIIGAKVQRELTAQKILKQLESSNHVKIEVVIETLRPKNQEQELLSYTNKKSHFKTWCGNSSDTRKNNIALALSSLNGKKIEAGETFSFNATTGERSEQRGYKKAKIISGGTFVEGTGGGVCQVSTTLYNAAVLAGLDIAEVHQHSLPVSYVAPSRDAMVSGTSADLKFINNTSGPIFIKANLVNNEDIVIDIFGKKNTISYDIESKVLGAIPHGKDEITYDISKATLPLKKGETQRISSPKDGYISEAFLVAKDKNGKIIYKNKMRHNQYAPTRGIIVQG